MDLLNSNSAMVLVLGFVGYRVLDQVIRYFFGKLVKDDYVTKKECQGCETHQGSAVATLAAEISTIKGLLLVIAVKAEIPAEQLAKLTK